MTSDRSTFIRLCDMLDGPPHQRLSRAPDMEALLKVRTDDDPIVVELVRAVDEVCRLGMLPDVFAADASDADLEALTAKMRHDLDVAHILYGPDIDTLCPPEVRARIPELIDEGEQLVPLVRRWCARAKALYFDVEEAVFRDDIPDNVRNGGFQAVGYGPLEELLEYLGGQIHDAWSPSDGSGMNEAGPKVRARYDALEVDQPSAARDREEIRRLRARVVELERWNDLRENALVAIGATVRCSDEQLTEAGCNVFPTSPDRRVPVFHREEGAYGDRHG